MLCLNGDSHVYGSDNPLQQGSTCYAESRATSPLEWLKLGIDPRAAWENRPTATSFGPFSWQREVQSQLTPTP